MFSGARRLEIRQNKNYGKDPEYQKYVKTVPILIPFIPCTPSRSTSGWSPDPHIKALPTGRAFCMKNGLRQNSYLAAGPWRR